jgi:hypothetical protein
MVFDPLALLIAEPVQEKAELPMNLDDGTSITQAIPSAAIRVRNPTASASGPRNSAVIARTIKGAAVPEPTKYFIVPSMALRFSTVLHPNFIPKTDPS